LYFCSNKVEAKYCSNESTGVEIIKKHKVQDVWTWKDWLHNFRYQTTDEELEKTCRKMDTNFLCKGEKKEGTCARSERRLKDVRTALKGKRCEGME
jgi:hypothetical protein